MRRRREEAIKDSTTATISSYYINDDAAIDFEVESTGDHDIANPKTVEK